MRNTNKNLKEFPPQTIAKNGEVNFSPFRNYLKLFLVILPRSKRDGKTFFQFQRRIFFIIERRLIAVLVMETSNKAGGRGQVLQFS